MLKRQAENGLFDALGQVGAGMIAFSPLAQGLLSSRYLDGIPVGSRAARGTPLLSTKHISPELLDRLRALNDIARARGQTLAQLALAWVLRDRRMTSAIIGVSSVDQLHENLAALQNLTISPEEIAAIDLVLQ
jgi:L-glyceraldehyde 3-phosphate reductase